MSTTHSLTQANRRDSDDRQRKQLLRLVAMESTIIIPGVALTVLDRSCFRCSWRGAKAVRATQTKRERRWTRVHVTGCRWAPSLFLFLPSQRNATTDDEGYDELTGYREPWPRSKALMRMTVLPILSVNATRSTRKSRWLKSTKIRAYSISRLWIQNVFQMGFRWRSGGPARTFGWHLMGLFGGKTNHGSSGIEVP